jgi:hypothetical protein
MTHRALKNHVQRRYRAGARLALLATLLVGTAVSGVFGTSPTVEISHHAPAAPAEMAPSRANPSTSPAVPPPEIEPTSLPAPATPPPAAYRDALQIDGPIELERPAVTPSVERMVL